MNLRAYLSKLTVIAAVAVIPILVAAQDTPAAVTADYGPATLRHWVPPTYPAAALKAKREARVRVTLVVDAEGQVTDATADAAAEPEFAEAAVAAVRQWRFGAALEEGKPVASALDVVVPFRVADAKRKPAPIMPPIHELPLPLPVKPWKAKVTPDPSYPPELEESKLPGIVEMEFLLGESGKPESPRVRWASHPAFVEQALRTLERSTFEPARQGPLAKPTVIQYPVQFDSVGARRPDILAANRLTPLDETAPLPGPFVLVEPVYPHDLLLAGTAGTAVAEFTVDTKGSVQDVTVTAASAPEFGAALVAALDSWQFQPAKVPEGTRFVRLKVERGFQPGGPLHRLVVAQQPGGAGISSARGLDQRLTPRWRGLPVYPAALRAEGPSGTATIEFVIDRDGRARLPKVLNASRPEFGWAAATAISQWVFDRPMRNGEPVDVLVQIELSFKPPGPDEG